MKILLFSLIICQTTFASGTYLLPPPMPEQVETKKQEECDKSKDPNCKNIKTENTRNKEEEDKKKHEN